MEALDASLTVGVGAVVGSALALRAATWRVLTHAQRTVRGRASARPAPSVWAVPGPVLGELVLGVVVGLVIYVLVYQGILPWQPYLTHDALSIGGGALAGDYHLPLVVGWALYVVTIALGVVGWPLLWFLTQRTLRSAGAPDGSWTSSPAGRLRVGTLMALRSVLTPFLPGALVLTAVVWQGVSYLASRRYRSRGAAVPTADTPATDAPTAEAPAADTPAPDAPTAGPGYAAPEPPAVTPPPRRPAPYVPTQADPVAGPVPSVPHQRLHPGEARTIGGYQLLGRIGAGGMGTVYLARREGAATQVALKTINPELLDNADLLRRFQRESEVLSMVPGAYTARVLDSGVDAGRPYLAMELLDGRPLDAYLGEQGPLRSPDALRALALALAVALSGVHRLGLVHRDLKPANIMLTTAGPRLLDFGIADLVDGTRLTRTGAGPGTLTYMAPEQFGEERVGPAADVWAWACCVVCAAHGTSPFAATGTGAVIRRIMDTGPAPAALAAVRALAPELADAVVRALTPDPAGRPSDGAALVALLTSRGGPHHEPTRPDGVREEITRGWRTLRL